MSLIGNQGSLVFVPSAAENAYPWAPDRNVAVSGQPSFAGSILPKNARLHQQKPQTKVMAGSSGLRGKRLAFMLPGGIQRLVSGIAVGSASAILHRFRDRVRRRQAASVQNSAPVLTPECLGWKVADDLVLRTRLERALELGGLDGRALKQGKRWPQKREVLQAIPRDCLVKDTGKSLMYAALSAAQVLGCGFLAWQFIPLSAAAIPLWILYAVVQGTLATGPWVIGHECGHDAFCDQRWLQTLVGYTFHTALMVPYFSWQRSHAVHHSRTNHMTEGETHVPRVQHGPHNKYDKMADLFGMPLVGTLRLVTHLVLGWPAYILSGATGGPKYGVTNHLWPYWPFRNGERELFPGRTLRRKVLKSDVGVIAVMVLLSSWAGTSGFATVIALYLAPLVVTNCWLVLYTWLQHTDVDIPHFDGDTWTWAKGAFHTVDRPYGPIIDYIHHQIGSTHVAHHVCPTIPHYKARKATEALKAAFPDLYLYDPTPVSKALWRVASRCRAVQKMEGNDGMYIFT